VIAEIERRIREVVPRAVVKVVDMAPVVGAALFGLDKIGAGEAAKARLRAATQRVPGVEPTVSARVASAHQDGIHDA
jgi:hypothetical protein